MSFPKRDSEWSEEEIQSAVDGYLEMLKHQKAGTPYIKADINRRLRTGGQPLALRSRSSIEYRMRNISSVLQQLGHETVFGYAPAGNVGEGVRSKLLKILNKKGIT